MKESLSFGKISIKENLSNCLPMMAKISGDTQENYPSKKAHRL